MKVEFSSGTSSICDGTCGEVQGHRLVGTAKPVGRDQGRFAAPAHHDFWTFPDGGPALEASLSHPTWKRRWRCVRCRLRCSASQAHGMISPFVRR